MIGKFVDAQFDRLLSVVEAVGRWVLEKPKPRNVWPDDLHGAEVRREGRVQAAQRSGVQASDSTATADAPEVKPVGSVVRDTADSTAVGGVAGEDAPQNQPPVAFPANTHECVCRACNCPEYLHLLKPEFIAGPLKCEGCPLGCRDYVPCLCDDQPVGEYIDPQVLLAGHADYERVKNEFNQK